MHESNSRISGDVWNQGYSLPSESWLEDRNVSEYQEQNKIFEELKYEMMKPFMKQIINK